MTTASRPSPHPSQPAHHILVVESGADALRWLSSWPDTAANTAVWAQAVEETVASFHMRVRQRFARLDAARLPMVVYAVGSDCGHGKGDRRALLVRMIAARMAKSGGGMLVLDHGDDGCRLPLQALGDALRTELGAAGVTVMHARRSRSHAGAA